MMDFFGDIPIWIWVVVGIVTFVFVFGDKKLWDFEAKFPLVEGVGRGEIELECNQKRGPHIECEFDLEDTQRNKPLDILLNDQHIFTVPAETNTGRFRLVEPLEIEKPQEGDLVAVKIDGRQVFSAGLVLD